MDAGLAELTAAAHDVARAVPPQRLLEEAGWLGLPANSVETHTPLLLHGPVGAAWLRNEGSVVDPGVLEGVRWHTTAHPDLAPVGKVVFLADKLDPMKSRQFPFQPQVREAAFQDLHAGMLAFLDGSLAQYLERGEPVHPVSIDARNTLLLAAGC